jgi:hypothetical protein
MNAKQKGDSDAAPKATSKKEDLLKIIVSRMQFEW